MRDITPPYKRRNFQLIKSIIDFTSSPSSDEMPGYSGVGHASLPRDPGRERQPRRPAVAADRGRPGDVSEPRAKARPVAAAGQPLRPAAQRRRLAHRTARRADARRLLV